MFELIEQFGLIKRKQNLSRDMCPPSQSETLTTTSCYLKYSTITSLDSLKFVC